MSLKILMDNLLKELEQSDFVSSFTDSLRDEGTDIIEVINAYDSTSEWLDKDEDEWENIPAEYNDWGEAVKVYAKRELRRLEKGLREKGDFDADGVVAARCITLQDNKTFIDALKRGETIQGVDGMGIWWSWDKDEAECHGDAGGSNWVVIEALIPFRNIDYRTMLLNNLHPSLGADEAEITVLKGKDIEILSVTDKKKDNAIWTGNQTVKAFLIAALRHVVT